MKSRSHRPPVSEPHHDDWVDGSWTVDCICGVTFDDGEEMVNCDECGVWVHTRCSRYVKTEKSFACNKCKSKKNDGGIRNDSEETEVAEFLVELPTKTLRMDNPNPPVAHSRKPFRLWTDIPMDERVHVQGVPGGDPQLFAGNKMSPIFGPELWKCTGYVPKKFNFRYNEFPILHDGKDTEEKQEECRRSGEENLNQVDNGAGVLFSLSKENDINIPTPLLDSVGFKSPVGSDCHEPVRQKKKLDKVKLDVLCPEDTVKKDTSIVRPIVFRSGKRRKEESGMSKDSSAKKKVRTVEKERNVKKHGDRASKPGLALSSDANQLEFSQGRDSNAASDGIHSVKGVNRDQLSDYFLGECATNLASDEHGPEDTVIKNDASHGVSREGKRGDEVHVSFENFSNTNGGGASVAEAGGLTKPVNKEICGDAGGITGFPRLRSHDREPMAVDVSLAGSDSKESQNGHDTNVDKSNLRPNKKLKTEVADDHGGLRFQSLSVVDVKSDTKKSSNQHLVLSKSPLSENGRASEKPVLCLEATQERVHPGSRGLTIGDSTPDKSVESLGNRNQFKRDTAWSDGSNGLRKRTLGNEHSSEVTEEAVKFCGDASSHSTTYQRKVVVSAAKFASASANTISKSSENDTAAPVDGRRKETSQSDVVVAIEKPSIEVARDAEKGVRPKKLLKESSRLQSVSKVPHSTKSSHPSDSKKMSADSKDAVVHSPSNVPSIPSVEATPVSGESASPPQAESAATVPNNASCLPGKSEKVQQTVGLPSSKGSVAPVTAPTPSNVPATLSDEELALLLHQELNSSPRVPRVPRMRHAGSLPQLSCPTATNTLMKRTSSAKDHGMVPRRKTKDLLKEGSQNSLEVSHEPKKIERKPSSPDSRKRDSGMDKKSRRESEGSLGKGMHAAKTKNVSSSLSSSGDFNEQNLSSSHTSSRLTPDDDPQTIGRQSSNRTLPGLIAEIMSEGRRMAYEELCNAVLPHWPHLRKHNGERYAYSSHSQAVLDCLRNRSEWARLVDRGPKTTATRKRRKLDIDSMSIESDDNEDSRGKRVKEVERKSFESHQEEFPKGKRKARKRRRLALQGRGIVRRRRRADVVSDDESESFSSSSEDSMSSEDEIQGDGTSSAGNEASDSSEEAR